MIFRVFYDRKDFFGQWDYNVDEHTTIQTKESMTDAMRKCFSSFGRVRNFCFRAESEQRGGEFYLVERRSNEDAMNGTYTVTHRRSTNNIEQPIKMSGNAIKALIKNMYEDEEKEKMEEASA